MTSLETTYQPGVAFRRVCRFLTVGLLGTFVDIGLFALLRASFGIDPILANVIAYSAGIINNYVLHRMWTFDDAPPKPIAVQFTQFAVISVSAMVLNTALVLLLSEPFGTFVPSPWYGEMLAKITATAVGAGWNFLANLRWTFPLKGQHL